MTADDRILIVNADDFGLSPGVNRGIVEAHRHGIVTSTSAMVRPAAAIESAQLARELPHLSVGLHVVLGEWVYHLGEWQTRYEVVPLSAGPALVESEVRRQVAAFIEIFGRPPTHLDSHQHLHRHEPLRSIMRRLAAELGVPLRHEDARIRHCGGFYGQTRNAEPFPDGISVESLTRLLNSLAPGITEMGCHPGLGECDGSSYAQERECEVRTLCHPQIRNVLEQGRIQLRSFTET